MNVTNADKFVLTRLTRAVGEHFLITRAHTRASHALARVNFRQKNENRIKARDRYREDR